MSRNAVLFEGLVFPEGVRWRRDGLWVSDQHTHKVWRITDDGAGEVMAEFEDMPSGLGFLPDGSVLVAEMRTQRLHRIEPDGSVRLHADLSPLRSGWVNDMVVDGKGRAYVGHLTGKYAQRTGQPDQLVLVEPDGAYRVVLEDIYGPNGTIVTPDNRTLILTEGHSQRLLAFDIEEDGALTNRRLWADNVSADGICLDAEGAVWAGVPGERSFQRILRGGAVTDRIDVPDLSIACVLGGPSRTTLYMLVTRISMDTFARMNDPGFDHLSDGEGRIETRQVMVPGAGWP